MFLKPLFIFILIFQLLFELLFEPFPDLFFLFLHFDYLCQIICKLSMQLVFIQLIDKLALQVINLIYVVFIILCLNKILPALLTVWVAITSFIHRLLHFLIYKVITDTSLKDHTTNVYFSLKTTLTSY